MCLKRNVLLLVKIICYCFYFQQPPHMLPLDYHKATFLIPLQLSVLQIIQGGAMRGSNMQNMYFYHQPFLFHICSMNFYIFINAYHFSGLKMKCKLCEFTCTTVSEYLRHCTNSHSSRSYMPQLPCNRCHLVFNSKTRFYEHYKEHTKSDDVGKETRIINNSKVLTCSHCKENFSSFDIYKSHLRSALE